MGGIAFQQTCEFNQRCHVPIVTRSHQTHANHPFAVRRPPPHPPRMDAALLTPILAPSQSSERRTRTLRARNALERASNAKTTPWSAFKPAAENHVPPPVYDLLPVR
jgi:hypothetical protein